MEYHHLSSERLTIAGLKEILDSGKPVALSEELRRRIVRCREYLDRKIKDSDQPVYGITTGFGSLCDISVGGDELSQLQRNLVMSHSCGTGEQVPSEIVRLMLLLKIRSLSYGYSGWRPSSASSISTTTAYSPSSTGRALLEPQETSHRSRTSACRCSAWAKSNMTDAADPLPKSWRNSAGEFGWKPLELQSKEGLALLNGTQFMSAYGVQAVIDARRLSDWADRIGALSLDAFDGRIEPFYDEVHVIRAHPGQLATARAVRSLLEGSELIRRPKKHVQDPYSFRCMPQVHGATKDTIDYVAGVLETEINSPTDNPTIFPDEDMIISAGNFHGQPIALAMDFLAIALSELGSISERRIYKLISGSRGLPHFLVANPGLNSGFMIPQYTAASIVSQSKGLCMPASVDSIPSSQGQEDHVSMGANAATKLRRVVLNTERVLAIELFNAAQALEFRRPAHTSPALENLVADYRRRVPFIDNDTVMYPYIEASVQFLREQ